MLKVGCRWCDCPTDYGPSTTVYNRFNRWSRRGFWLKLLDALVDAGAVTKNTAIDSTYVKETIFKRRLWTRGPEEKLLQYLRTIPPLSAFIGRQFYRDAQRGIFYKRCGRVRSSD